MENNLLNQIQHLYKDVNILYKTYEKIPNLISWGNASYALYGDYLEVSNYQINSTKSAVLLAKKCRYRDAFIILRTVFENYLVFILMTKGKYYLRFFNKQNGENIDSAIQ